MSGAKRAFDVLVSGGLLLALSPLMLAVALAVRLSSPGPLLFRQERVGLHGRLFRIRKFRTMRVGDGSGPQVTASGDQRITRVGHVLRRYKLDELPQLLDVLTGSMSLVGPRPEVPRYMQHYAPQVRAQILSVRPGITDNAAIVFRNEEQLLAGADDVERTYVDVIMPIKQQYYLDYVNRHSVAGDVMILARTFWALVGPQARTT